MCDLFLDWKLGGVAHGAELRSWGAKAPPFMSGVILRIAPLMKGGTIRGILGYKMGLLRKIIK